MKRAVLIVVSGLALAGLLIADIAWPKASTADETPASAPAAQAGATPQAAASSVPKPATAETSESASQGTTAEGASAQNMPGSVEDALDQLDDPAAAGSASAAAASGDEKESKAEAPAADESGAR
jgi:cytoskeletal protein RodZ